MTGKHGLQLNLAQWQQVTLARLTAVSHRFMIAMKGVEMLPDGTHCQALGQSVMNFTVGPPPVAMADSKGGTSNWLAGVAITSTVDAITLTCEEAWRIALMAEKCPGGGLLISPVPAHLDIWALAAHVLGESTRAFDTLTLGEKIQRLETKLGCTMAHRAELDALRRVRNCLVHRFGVVASRDADSNGELAVHLTAFRLVAEEADGTQHALEPGLLLEHGGTVYLRSQERELRFRVGTLLALTAQDAMDLLSMAFPVVNDIATATNAFVEKAGTAEVPRQP